jgi:hypothetical protein
MNRRRNSKSRFFPAISGSALAVLLAFSSAARADDSFSVTLTPYPWFAGINGKVGARDVETNIDKCFTDIVDHSNSVFGLFGRVDVRYGPFGFYMDGGWTVVIVADRTQVVGLEATGAWYGGQISAELARVIVGVAIRYSGPPATTPVGVIDTGAFQFPSQTE